MPLSLPSPKAKWLMCQVMIAEREWRGRGLGSEAAALIMRYAKDELRRTRFQVCSCFCCVISAISQWGKMWCLEVKIGLGNAASLALFTDKFGFVRLRDSAAFQEATLGLDWAAGAAKLLDASRHYRIQALHSQ